MVSQWIYPDLQANHVFIFKNWFTSTMKSCVNHYIDLEYVFKALIKGSKIKVIVITFPCNRNRLLLHLAVIIIRRFRSYRNRCRNCPVSATNTRALKIRRTLDERDDSYITNKQITSNTLPMTVNHFKFQGHSKRQNNV